MGLRQWLREISLPVYLLIFVFGWSSWIDINGVFAELPLLVNRLPESWNLPSYLTVVIQVANIGPLAFTIANRLEPQKVKEWPVVYVIIAVGAVSVFLLTFFWDATSIVGGREHSVGLLVLVFFLAFVDCTSSVVYLPYMSIFKPQYMTAFYIGEGLSGFIPSLLGFAQGLGSDPRCINVTGPNGTVEVWPEYDDPRFSVSEYFYVLFAMLCLSGIAFTGLNFGAYCKKEMISNKQEYNMEKQEACYDNPTFTDYQDNRDDDGKDLNAEPLDVKEIIILLVMCGWSNAMTNGVIASTQTYTCMPYGNRAYNLSVRLSLLCNPLACFLALFVASRSKYLVTLLTLLGTVMTGYHLYLAALSPAPPLQDSVWGEVIVVATSMLAVFFYSYVKVCVATTVVSSVGRRGLLWVGVVTQIGSIIGSLGIFVVTSILNLFKDMPACP